MKIDYIKLKNFRQYKDDKIVFAHPEKNRNFTIIQGVTGAGKTNILNAITWCLYGEEFHIRKKYAGLPIVNTSTLRELSSGKSCEVEVEIRMTDKSDKKIYFRRTLEFRKLDDGEYKILPDLSGDSPDGSKFEIVKQIGEDMVPIREPTYVLSRLIPRSINEYFFFDGEKLDDYFKEASGESIREAVFKISQIDLLENAIEHLNIQKRNFLRSAKGLSSEAEEIRERLEMIQRSLEKFRNNLKELKSEKEKAAKKEMGYSEKLKASSPGLVKRLEEERSEINETLEKLDNEIKELEKDRSDFLIKFAAPIFAYEPISKTKKLISGRKEAGEIPPDYKRTFIENLLKQTKCICGTDISVKNKKFREKVKSLLKECSELSEISEELITENVILGSILDDLRNFRNEQVRYGKELKELEDEIKIKNNRLAEIHEQIKGSDIKQIKAWESKLQEYKGIKEDKIGQIREAEYRIKQTEDEITRLNRRLDEELKKEERYKEIRKFLAFCDESLDSANKIKNEIMESIRKEIEELTRKQFFSLIWKKETYKDVKIDKNYNISVVHQSGMEAIGTLSAGERQVLALSFMAALNTVSGFNAPIVIDTPLGRLSKEPKKNIASKLPNYLKDKQVTLLVTDEEYTPEVKEKLSNRIGKEYRIDFKETKVGSIARVVSYAKQRA